MSASDGDSDRPDASLDILNLMMPTYSGNAKDECGKEVVPPLPLSFDRVCEGRRPVSDARLFKIPLEVLSRIIQYIPGSALASLAYVNSDCRQLARSRQFASLHFDYSRRTFELLALLIKESLERRGHASRTKKPALGPCIRRITVATQPKWIQLRHKVKLSQDFVALPQAERDRRFADARHTYFDCYLASIQILLSDPATMPHLELLDFEDRITLLSGFLEDAANSKIQHFKLHGVSVDEVFTMKPPISRPSQLWPLRTLYLEILPGLSTGYEMEVSRLCTSVVHLCAATLESLTWAGCVRQKPSRTDQLGPSPQFPSLRYLRLESLNFGDDVLLQQLVSDDLRCLDVDLESSPVISNFFEHRGRVPALETFIWNSRRLSETSLIFLQANPQLYKFNVPIKSSPTLLNDQLLPLLVSSFHNLTSLSLVWNGTQIEHEALEQIGKITTLKQLHLSAGAQAGWQHDWLIDHQAMQNYLSSLTLLKKLAFSRDSYSNGFVESCEHSYEDEFEEGHRECILEVADEYFEKLPQLEWLYFGQIVMAAEWSAGSQKKTARPLVTERDSCWTLLREMFGWKGLFSS